MITISNLSKHHGKRVLFDNISLSINEGEKIGLIGPNGAGKTTLFSIILGETEATSGSVHIHKHVRVGYLSQESHFASERTVIQEVTEGDKTLIALHKEKEQLEETHQAGSHRYSDIMHQLDTMGYFQIEYKAKEILAGLGFKQRDFDRPITQLSGGWQMRTLLAKLLILPYDILLLDEPTNYLDLNASLWFKDYLSDFKGTFIMISHDKAFLNEVTNYTLVMEEGRLTKIQGNYEQYRQAREERRQHLLKQFKEQERRREQLQRFVDRFHAQPNKATQVRAKKKFIDMMEEIVVPDDPRESIRDFSFPPTRQSGHRVMSLEKISKSYGDIRVYQNLDFEILQGEKAVLAGENGAGKSTLLKILAGVVGIDGGERKAGHNVDIGYFSQTRMDVLNPENTVLEEAFTAAAQKVTATAIRTILSLFLFKGSDVDKKVKILSGGEKSRLILAKLLINPPNFLLLDEPTTHLDVDAVDALIKALTEYAGTVVFISHDIHFVRSLANFVFEVKQGQVRKFHGNFDYYLEKVREEKTPGEKKQTATRPVAHGTASASHADHAAKQEKKLQDKEQRKAFNIALANQIKKIQKDRSDLDTEMHVKKTLLDNPRIYHDKKKTGAYHFRIHQIEEQLLQLDLEIDELNKQFIK